jgi:hypothetical protein
LAHPDRSIGASLSRENVTVVHPRRWSQQRRRALRGGGLGGGHDPSLSHAPRLRLSRPAPFPLVGRHYGARARRSGRQCARRAAGCRCAAIIAVDGYGGQNRGDSAITTADAEAL